MSIEIMGHTTAKSGNILAMDLAGNEIWQYSAGQPLWSYPIVAGNNTVCFGTNGAGIDNNQIRILQR